MSSDKPVPTAFDSTQIDPHPDFSLYSPNELKDQIFRLQDDITFISSHGGDRDVLAWLLAERKLAEAELGRRNALVNGNGNGKGPHTDEEQKVFWPDVLDAKALLALPPDPTRWVWNECLPLRATSALVAKSYTGKSTFAASLAVCVARGIPFLNRPTQKGVVLYVYLDGPFDELKENFHKVGLIDGDDVFFYAGRRPDKVIEWVKGYVELKNVKLLIIDTAQKFFGFKEDRYEEKINKMQPMLDLVDEKNFHAMFTWHAAKNCADTVTALGSCAAEANARVSLYLRRFENTEQRIFETVQNSGKKFEQIGISDPNDTGIIERVGTVWDVQLMAAKAKIREVLKEYPGSQEVYILDEVEMRKKTIKIALRKMLDAGEVERVRSNPAKHNSAFKYYMAGQVVPDPEEGPENLF